LSEILDDPAVLPQDLGESALRILFLSHYFPPEVNAPASRTFEHCRIWAKHGHDVAVATCVPNHPAGKIYPNYRNGLLQKEMIEGIRVYRLLTLVTANSGFVFRTLNYLIYCIAAIVAAPFLPRCDIVVSTSPQFFCGLAGYFVSRIKRVPWVLEIRDLWPESILAVGAMRNSRWIRLLEWLESFAYRKADHIVSLTDSFKTHIVKHGASAEKVSIIKNGVDLDFYNPDQKASALAKELGVEGKFIAAYVGTHGMAHGLDTVLEAAEVLQESDDIAILLVGDGAERERLVALRDAKGLQNVVMLGQQPKERMPAIWILTDASLVILRDQEVFRTVIPSKIFESMAMQRPIVLGVRGESQQLIKDAGSGICIEPENAAELADAITRLARNRELRAAMGVAGRRYVEKHFDRQKLAGDYQSLLADLTLGKRNLRSSATPVSITQTNFD
jgi:glycosyltransferase involved in cell wall biosynthesis